MRNLISRSAATLIIIAILTSSAGAVAPREMAPARDGNIAIEQELCAARAKATVAAYDLFLARHPKHPLATTARAERTKLLRRGRR